MNDKEKIKALIKIIKQALDMLNDQDVLRGHEIKEIVEVLDEFRNYQ